MDMTGHLLWVSGHTSTEWKSLNTDVKSVYFPSEWINEVVTYTFIRAHSYLFFLCHRFYFFHCPHIFIFIFAVHAGYLYVNDTLTTQTIMEPPSVECQDHLIPCHIEYMCGQYRLRFIVPSERYNNQSRSVCVCVCLCVCVWVCVCSCVCMYG